MTSLFVSLVLSCSFGLVAGSGEATCRGAAEAGPTEGTASDSLPTYVVTDEYVSTWKSIGFVHCFALLRLTDLLHARNQLQTHR